MRLDLWLFGNKLARSRSHARDLIKREKVLVRNTIVKKPSYDVSPELSLDEVQVLESLYVGRGAIKLKGAIEHFKVDLLNKIVLDVGASTGGFTEFALEKGAKHVLSLDVGTGQLAEKLRQDVRVSNLEGQDIRTWEAEEKADLAVVDVSFISLKLVLESVFKNLKSPHALVLLKPQFEAGREGLNSKGLCRNPESAMRDFLSWLKGRPFGGSFREATPSDIEGGDGNLEYFLYFCADS